MRATFGSDPTAGSKILSFKFISRYSGWMPSQIKIELSRRGARARGRKADLVQI